MSYIFIQDTPLQSSLSSVFQIHFIISKHWDWFPGVWKTEEMRMHKNNSNEKNQFPFVFIWLSVCMYSNGLICGSIFYSFCCFTFLNSGILLIFGSANKTVFFIVHFACLSTSPFGNNKNNTSLQCYAWLPFSKQFPVTTLYTISTFVEEHWNKRSFPNSCFYGVSIRCIIRDRPHKWSALKLKPKSENKRSLLKLFCLPAVSLYPYSPIVCQW